MGLFGGIPGQLEKKMNKREFIKLKFSFCRVTVKENDSKFPPDKAS